MFYISNVIGNGQARDNNSIMQSIIKLLICKFEIASYPV